MTRAIPYSMGLFIIAGGRTFNVLDAVTGAADTAQGLVKELAYEAGDVYECMEFFDAVVRHLQERVPVVVTRTDRSDTFAWQYGPHKGTAEVEWDDTGAHIEFIGRGALRLDDAVWEIIEEAVKKASLEALTAEGRRVEDAEREKLATLMLGPAAGLCPEDVDD